MLVSSSRAVTIRSHFRATRLRQQRNLATVPPPTPGPTSGPATVRPAPIGTPQIPPPPRARTSPIRRFLVFTSLSAVVFYGGSTYASLKNPTYADFFTENIPGGDTLVDYAESSSWTQSLKSTDVADVPQRAVEAASAGYERVSGAIQRVMGEAGDKVEDAKREGKRLESKGEEAMSQGRKQLKEMVSKVEEKVEDANIKERAKKTYEDVQKSGKEIYEDGKKRGMEAYEDAQKQGKKLYGDARKQGKEAAERIETKSEDLLDRAKRLEAKAEEEIQRNTPLGGRGVTRSASSSPSLTSATGAILPLQHEAPEGSSATAVRDRGVRAEPNDPLVRLRDPPALPSLPRLAPSLSSLSGSEPMIAQLAGTVDELAAFLRETPNSGTQARAVLDDAKKDLSKLYERLEQVKRTEAEKLKKGLESQRSKYDAELKKAADNARLQVGMIDEKWKKEQESLRQREAKEYEDKLKKELATQSEIINQRLKEEVVSQGIEMQRRWMKEIKSRVDAERGGRLAKLDELAKDLGDLQKISLDNSQALEENASAIAVDAALRELNRVALDEQDQIGIKSPFIKQLTSAKKSIKGKESNDLLLTVLEQLDSSKPEEGVESFSTLYSWFTQKVRPAVQRVALVPENSGILSHLMSSSLSPLLFGKSGFPQGDDVPSVLARSQFYLERRDLDGAAREINQLKGWPKILVEDWLQAARKRLEVEQHVQVAQVEAHFAALQTA